MHQKAGVGCVGRGLNAYDPLTDDDAIALTFPSSRHTNRRLSGQTRMVRP